MKEKPLVDQTYLLEKYPGKGGWTYAAIPEIAQDKQAPFGWVQVKGSIDGYALKHYKLMPMGNGKLFLPVKAEIRKKIGKKEGDRVHVILYADTSPIELPEDLKECLDAHPAAYKKFRELTAGQQKTFIDHIFAAKTDETKVKRINKMLDELEKKIR